MAKEHRIAKIEPGSIAEELELEPGDILLSVNDQEIDDVFDYHYLINDAELTVLVRKPDGEEWELEIEKDYAEDLGIEFENGLMDQYRSCQNKCMFCFIDQMPKGMRETLYFKDDDSRLSFLQGNYVTLTNMKEEDIERIIRYHLEPINVSVQTMNPKLRCLMLHNRFAGDALAKMERLRDAGVEMNGQIVLCKGVNDGAELEYSLKTLCMEYYPSMQSVSVVPVGLTKYRDGLYPLEPFEKQDARDTLVIIKKWQDYCMEQYGVHFVHASDEWYLTAELPIPSAEYYDGYKQLENGVGMMRLLEDEFTEALQQAAEEERKPAGEQTLCVATGFLSAPLLKRLAEAFMKQYPQHTIHVYPIRNDFFGERITVSGLLTGQDLVAQLKEKELGERVLLPCNLLRSGEEVFLDDMTLTEFKNALQVSVDIVKSSGQDLLEAFMGEES